MVLFRAVDIGADLFAIAAACVRARMLEEQGRPEAIDLADVFCRAARERIERNFRNLFGRGDVAAYRLAQAVLRGDHEWLEQGIIRWDETHDPERRSSVPPETPEPVVLGVGG